MCEYEKKKKNLSRRRWEITNLNERAQKEEEEEEENILEIVNK